MESIDFYIEETPPWRANAGLKSSKMLTNVSEWYSTRRKAISEKKKASLFIDFVYQSNLGEDVGTQTEEETETILGPYVRSESSKSKNDTSSSQKEKETLNTFSALKGIVELHKEMENTGMITVQQICSIHKELMDGLHHNCGRIRETKAYTITPDEEKYWYPPPEVIESKLYSVVDQHNYHMQLLQESNNSFHDKLVFLVKSAAWFLFHFVDTHPFSDGNGRMCRLLAGYTMMVLIPFPVHPYHVYTDEKLSSTVCSSRKDYIDAVVSCRRHLNQEPSHISALLIDGLYNGWLSCKE